MAGLVVVYNSCISLNVFLFLKYREKIKNWWSKFNFSLIDLCNENKFDYYEVGNFFIKKNLFHYLSKEELSEI